jgi:hypothetical protein
MSMTMTGTDSPFVDYGDLSEIVSRKKRREYKRTYESWADADAGRMRVLKEQKARERKSARHRKQAGREVVALDGEGVTDPDGTHRYVMLAANTGDVIESEDLSTQQCLNFILALPSGPLLISYAFRYDVAMICRDIHPDALRRLWEGNVIRNGRYTMAYIPGRVFIVEDRWLQQRREVYDVFGFFQSSFVKALREWDIECDVDSISDMKDARGTFDAVDRGKVREYCLSECRALVSLFHRLRDACYGADLRPNRWWGAGALAGAMMKKYDIGQYLDGWEQKEYELRAYFGGRFELRESGEFEGVHSYDIRSAYPHIIRSLPCMAHATVEPITTYDPTVVHAIWRVDWNVGRNSPWTPFPFRYKGGVYYPWRGSGYYHAAEVRAAIALFGDGIDPKRGYRLLTDCDCAPFRFVPELYEYRAMLRANGDRAHWAIKLALNSLYGKTIQAVGWKGSVPRYRNVWWAGEITAGTRAMLLDAIRLNPDAVLSLATDGILTTEPIDLPIGEALGAWEYSAVDRARLYQPGVYELFSGDDVKRRSRGFAPRDVDWDRLWRDYLADPAYGKHVYDSTRFYGIGGSLNRVDIEAVFRRWLTVPRSIDFEPSRRVLRTDGVHWTTFPPDRPYDGLSEPYERAAVAAEESEESRTVELEQP